MKPAFWFLFVCLALLACAITTETDRINAALPKLSAEELLKEGEARMVSKDYAHARQYFKFLSENFPNSPQAVQALLRSAEAYELQGGWDNLVEARLRYSDFYNRFPQSEEAEYALYKQGKLSQDLKENPSREPVNIRAAIQNFNRYLQVYPSGSHTAEVKEGIRECHNQMAAHELEVARFYFKRKAYRAALGRLEFLERGYPEFEHMGEVYGLYAQVHQALGDAQMAQEYSLKAMERAAGSTNP
jgi:outer membrane protein assembly factor BamD